MVFPAIIYSLCVSKVWHVTVLGWWHFGCNRPRPSSALWVGPGEHLRRRIQGHNTPAGRHQWSGESGRVRSGLQSVGRHRDWPASEAAAFVVATVHLHHITWPRVWTSTSRPCQLLTRSTLLLNTSEYSAVHQVFRWSNQLWLPNYESLSHKWHHPKRQQPIHKQCRCSMLDWDCCWSFDGVPVAQTLLRSVNFYQISGGGVLFKCWGFRM